MSFSGASLVPTTKIKSVLVPGMRRWFEIIPRGGHRVEPEKLIISASKVESEITWARLNQLKQEDVTLEATVDIISRGGLIVSAGGVRGFIPASHVRTTEAAGEEGVQVGTVLPVKFLELDQAQERCLFSHRRALSDSQLKSFKVGDVVMGTIISVKAYGAFVDIGGDLNGLLHLSQISHDLLSHDKERGRISLSTKKLEPTPGDMIRNPQLVFEKADEMAAQFRERVAAAEAAARLEEARMQQMRESAFKEEGGAGEGEAAPSE